MVDRLIAEVEGNLARGYAFARTSRRTPNSSIAPPTPRPEVPDPKPRQCLVNVDETVTRPVAIDLQAEAAKLASLKAKRSQLASSTAQAIAACQMQYPE